MGKTGVGWSARKNSKTIAVDKMPIAQKKRLYLRKKVHIAFVDKVTQTPRIKTEEHLEFDE